MKNLKYLLFVVLLHSLEVSAANLYRILSVSPQADTAEITRAYRKLAQQWHPDRNSSSNAEAMFMEIREAYEILKNPDQRRHYDYDRTGNTPSMEHIFHKFKDIGGAFIHKDQKRMDEHINDLIDTFYEFKLKFSHNGELERQFNRLKFLFYKKKLDFSSWKDVTEKKRKSIIQYSMLVALNNSEVKRFRKQALDVLDLVQLDLSEFNQLNHLSNDKKAPKAIRSRARKIVKKAAQLRNIRNIRNICQNTFRVSL